MQALKTYGAKNGKIIDVEFVAYKDATSIPILNKILNSN
jgi:hypothetical protein